MKRIILLSAGAIVALLVILGGILATLDLNKHRPAAEAQLSQALGRQVTMSTLKLRLWPLSIQIKGFTIADDPRFAVSAPFAAAEEVSSKAGIFSLLSGKPQLEELVLLNPVIHLVCDKDGKWNYSTLGTTSKRNNSSSSNFSLALLTLTDGLVTIADQRLPDEISQYDHIDVTVKEFSALKPFQLTASLHLPGAGTESLAMRATIGPLNQNEASATPIDAHLDIQNVALQNFARFLAKDSKQHYGGTMAGTADLRIAGGNMTTSGTVAFNRIAVGPTEIHFPINLTFKVLGNTKESIFELAPVDFQLDRQHFVVTGKVNSKPASPELDLDVVIPPSSIAEIAHLAGTLGAAVGIDATGSLLGKIKIKGTSANPLLSGTATLSNASFKPATLTKPIEVRNAAFQFDQDSVMLHDLNIAVASTTLHGTFGAKNFKHPQLSFKLIADTLNITELQNLKAPTKSQPATAGPSMLETVSGGGEIEVGSILAGGLELDKVSSKLQFEHGDIRLSPLNASMFSGSASGAIELNLHPKVPAISVQLAINGLDANNLLTAVTATKDTLFGTLSGKTNLQFTIAPDGDIVHTLNGNLGFNLTNGKIRNLDMMTELAKVAKFTGAPPPQNNETPIKKLSGDLQFTNGLATTSNLAGEIPQGSVSTKGTINLGNQALDLKLVAVLASGPSKSLGGQLVGGFMNTVLANKNGELVIPANVKGTTAKPIITPDLEAFAKMKLSTILPTSGNLSSLGGAVLGALQGQQPSAQSSTPQTGAQKAAGIAGGFLKAFGKQKKTDQ